MYRLVLYVLTALVATATLFSVLGILPFSPINLVGSTLLILAVCWVSNRIFAKVFSAIPNVESVYITGFILALIITPVAPTDYAGIGFLVFASASAMASKYLFAIGKKHLFNPAAFGVALSALVLGQGATWWVAGPPLLPLVLVGGLLIVYKIRRFDLVLSFACVALLTVVLTSPENAPLTVIGQTLQHSTFFFLALVMLTEPLTTPPTRLSRVLYGAIVGFFFAPNLHLGSLYLTPELALLIGNVFAYSVSPKGRFLLTLLEKKEIARGTYEFTFTSDRPLTFRAGQYLEWTLAHSPSDDRGNRRFFTIASAPTEDVVRLGVRVSESGSTFKRALMALESGAVISASQLAGDFVLPTNREEKLAFIAGGIGITPFRSQIQYLLDTKDGRSAVLLYSNKTAAEIAYKDLFEHAQKEIGLKTFYAVTDESNPPSGIYAGRIDGALIAREIPDYRERVFYISGPHAMVEAFETTLHTMGVLHANIKTDYFPGYA